MVPAAESGVQSTGCIEARGRWSLSREPKASHDSGSGEFRRMAK